MAFTAADVKKLREMTSVGMMDCKKALTEADGDFDAAGYRLGYGGGFFDRTLAVVGMLNDKDIVAALQPLKDKVDVWHVASLSGPR